MLTKRKRRFLFSLSIVAFLLLTILVLLYSLGYRIGPGLQLRKTGGIFLETQEAGAHITLDGTEKRTTTFITKNVFLKNLRPGKHKIIVSKENFWNWEKMLEVKSEIVASRSVLMIPKNIEGNTTDASIIKSLKDKKNESSLVKNKIYQNVDSKTQVLFSGVKKFWTIPQSNDLLILGEDGLFYRNKELFSDISTTTTALLRTKQHIIFDDLGNRLIYWDSYTIGTQWIGAKEKMPQWQTSDSLHIFTSEYPIKEVWVYPTNADYLIASIGEGVWVIEMESSGIQNAFPLYKGKDPRLVLKTSDAIYISDSDYLFEIQLP